MKTAITILVFIVIIIIISNSSNTFNITTIIAIIIINNNNNNTLFCVLQDARRLSAYNQPRDRQHVYSSIEEDVSRVDSGGGEGVGGGCGGDRGGVGLQPAPR